MICQNCGKEFETPVRPGPRPKRCTGCDRHRRLIEQGKLGTHLVCQRCGNEFDGKAPQAKYCVECRPIVNLDRTRERNAKRAKERRESAPTWKCKRCGREFKSYYKEHRHCPECVDEAEAEAHRQRTKRNRRDDEGGHINHRARKALRKMYGHVPPLMYERINKRSVLVRDHWTCWICGKSIDPKAEFPDKGYATIDHRVSLSTGGSHLYENVRAAHYKCNCSKGNRA